MMDDKQVDRLCLVLDDINDSIARIAMVLERNQKPISQLAEERGFKIIPKIAAEPTNEYGDKE